PIPRPSFPSPLSLALFRALSLGPSSWARRARWARHARALSNGRDLYGFEVDQRLVVVDDRRQLRGARARQVALRLRQLERRRQADVEALVLGVEPLLGELARLGRGFDSLQVRRHAAGGVADLGRDSQLELREDELSLLLLAPS